MPNQNDIRQAITNQIISALEVRHRAALATTVAARQERRGTRQRREQEVYRGFNPILLDVARREAPTDLEVVRNVQPMASVGRSGNAATAACPRGSVGMPDLLLDPGDQDRPHR